MTSQRLDTGSTWDADVKIDISPEERAELVGAMREYYRASSAIYHLMRRYDYARGSRVWEEFNQSVRNEAADTYKGECGGSSSGSAAPI